MCRRHAIKAKPSGWEGLAKGFAPPDPAPLRRVVSNYMKRLGFYTAMRAARLAPASAPATKAAKSAKVLWDQGGYDASDFQAALIPVITPILETVAPAKSKAYNRLRMRVGLHADEITVNDPRLAQAASELALDLAQSTLDTAAGAVDKAVAKARQSILDGTVEGKPAAVIAKAVNRTFTGLATWGAERIARTEVIRAYHAADRLSAIDSGVVSGWEWLASDDACPKCLELNGRRIGVKESFGDHGGSGAYADVPHPPLHPHCGCTVLPIIDNSLIGADAEEAGIEAAPAIPDPVVPEPVAEPEPPSHAAITAQAEAALETAWERVNERNGYNNFVALYDLRAEPEFAQYPREVQDAVINKARADWKYSLDNHEGLHVKLTKEQYAAGIPEAGTDSLAGAMGMYLGKRDYIAPNDPMYAMLMKLKRQKEAASVGAPPEPVIPPPPVPSPAPVKPIARPKPVPPTQPTPEPDDDFVGFAFADEAPPEPVKPAPKVDPLAFLPEDFNPAKLSNEEWAKYTSMPPKEFAQWYNSRNAQPEPEPTPAPIPEPAPAPTAPVVAKPTPEPPTKPKLVDISNLEGPALIAQAEADLETAWERINTKNNYNNFVALYDLRAEPEFTRYPREIQDAAINKVRNDWKFSLDNHEGLHVKLTKEQYEAGIPEAGTDSLAGAMGMYMGRRDYIAPNDPMYETLMKLKQQKEAASQPVSAPVPAPAPAPVPALPPVEPRPIKPAPAPDPVEDDGDFFGGFALDDSDPPPKPEKNYPAPHAPGSPEAGMMFPPGVFVADMTPDDWTKFGALSKAKFNAYITSKLGVPYDASGDEDDEDVPAGGPTPLTTGFGGWTALGKPRKDKPIPQPDPKTFPQDPNALRSVQALGGSTGAELVTDEEGNLFVRKRGANADHLRAEDAADRLYRALGVPVPESVVIETPEGPVKLARYLEDAEPLSDVLWRGGEEAEKVKRELAKHYAADALLGNWDVIGMSQDNVLVKDGVPYRVDNGGSLQFRAQGERKTPEQFSEYPFDILTMRSAATNETAAEVYGSISHAEVVASMEAAASAKVDWRKLAGDEAGAILERRQEEMALLAADGRKLNSDGWKDGFGFAAIEGRLKTRQAGVAQPVAGKRFTQNADGEMVADDGQVFAGIRGKGSASERLNNLLQSEGLDEVYKRWIGSQTLNSWGNDASAMKELMRRAKRDEDAGEYWLKHDDAKMNRFYNQFTGGDADNELKTTRMLAHVWAANQELLASLDTPGNDPAKREMTLYRTEERAVMAKSGLKVGDTGKVKRGPAESFSIGEAVSVHGGEVTTQKVPHHRVILTYLWGHPSNPDHTILMGDHEREILADTRGIAVKYERGHK